ncbi:MAG: nicotinic acid mononucleotide adenylyltransferase, partial [Gammaproteobacteria bacterium]
LAEWVKKRGTDDYPVLFKQSAGLICGVQVTQLEISSTGIRTLLAAGKSPRYLLPDTVLDYIQKNNWY